MLEGFKWCPECDTVLPRSKFRSNPRQPQGVDPYCTPCFNGIKEANRIKHHGSTRNYHLKRRYGITEADFDRMSAEQDGVCAICREAPAAHVDHCHRTGRVRGLLCFNCNQALGNFRDRGDLMMLAVHYLERGAEATFRRPPGAVATISVGFDDADPRPQDEPRVPPGIGA